MAMERITVAGLSDLELMRMRQAAVDELDCMDERRETHSPARECVQRVIMLIGVIRAMQARMPIEALVSRQEPIEAGQPSAGKRVKRVAA